MERTVPRTASEEIELYLRTVYSLLRSSAEVQIRSLEELHAGMNSSLHLDARKDTLDTAAFVYSLLRLPDCMLAVQSVILGQSPDVFARHGYEGVENWEPVSARARRRRCYFNRKDTLACFIASRTDIDDVIPTLCAYQIEWNKLHVLLQRCSLGLIQLAAAGDDDALHSLAEVLRIPQEDVERLRVIWGQSFADNLVKIAQQRCRIGVRLLGGSLSEYWRVTRSWWNNIASYFPQLTQRPVYFISSNPHSVPNVLSGFAMQHKQELISFLERSENEGLLSEWKDIEERLLPSSQENFLYYVLKKYQQSKDGLHLVKAQAEQERNSGIQRITSEHYFDVEAQVIEVAHLDPANFDSRLATRDLSFLKKSDALILNIDYPLGLSAYNILTKIAEEVSPILGVYVMGKAATLNGVLGDVIIPNVVQDEHSQNTYMFQNAFTAIDVSPYLVYGTVLDNQKAVTVLGTFLQNARIMDIFYREEYTDFEMEAGPYLSAIYEMYRPKRHPFNEIVNLYGVPFDVGVLHYASDTPLSKGKNLGAGALSYYGMDSTYASTIAILRRIIALESKRIEG
jgi:hypothetical protein